MRFLPWISACVAVALPAAGCGGGAAAVGPPPCDSHGVSDTGPAWSPDGRTIAFRRELAHGIAIFTIPAAGGRAERITPPGRYGFLAWSPNSRLIALPVLRPSGKAQVLVVDTRAHSERVVAAGDAAGGRPSFSPDGRRLLIVQSRGERRSIGVVSARGGTVTRLTPLAGDAFEPSWSPDGRHIAYVRSTRNRGRIYVVDPAGKNRRPLTTDAAAAHVSQQGPVWSPDGTSVAFVAVEGPYSAEIDVARVADGTAKRIAGGGTGYDLHFAPRGGRLAYVAFGQDGGSRLYVTGIGGPDKAVAIDPAGFEPSWSPDGTRLVLAHQTSKYPSRLRVAGMAGGGMRRLTCQPT